MAHNHINSPEMLQEIANTVDDCGACAHHHIKIKAADCKVHMSQEEFIALCEDYPWHDYECLDCNAEISVPGHRDPDIQKCPKCASFNIKHVGVPRGDGSVEELRQHALYIRPPS